MKTKLLKLVCSLLLLGDAAPALSQSFYPSIDTNSYVSATTYYSINVGNTYDNGITATFTTLDNGGMYVNIFAPDTFAANINGAAVFNQLTSDSLVVTFSAPVTDFFLNFVADGTTGSTTMNLSAYLDSSLLGTASYDSSNPLNYDEGQINYQNDGGFDSLVISLGTPPSFADLWAVGADSAGVGSFGGADPVPEPATLALAGLGGLVGLIVRRRKQ
jgi:hypothetical protein